MIRQRASHHALALGLAVGVFASLTPFIGFHIILALAIAFLLRANLVGAAIGTALGNPLTFPFLWSLTYVSGCWILGLEPGLAAAPALLDASWLMRFQGHFWLIFVPMIVGALPLGLLAGGLAYAGALGALEFYKKRQRARLSAIGSAASRES